MKLEIMLNLFSSDYRINKVISLTYILEILKLLIYLDHDKFIFQYSCNLKLFKNGFWCIFVDFSVYFSEVKPKAPAYERFHHLITAAPTLNLPYKYKMLAEHFRGMDQVVSMLHNRNEMCTFSKLKVAVQKLTKR